MFFSITLTIETLVTLVILIALDMATLLGGRYYPNIMINSGRVATK